MLGLCNSKKCTWPWLPATTTWGSMNAPSSGFRRPLYPAGREEGEMVVVVVAMAKKCRKDIKRDIKRDTKRDIRKVRGKSVI